jgi:hypothetical protein
MVRTVLSAAVLSAVVALGSACTHPPSGPGHPHPTTTRPTGSTIPVDGWAIAGVTQYAMCGGAPGLYPSGCPVPAHPASETVVVVGDAGEVARILSGADGRFRIAVAPGTYTVRAEPISGPVAATVCDSRTVVVGALVQGSPAVTSSRRLRSIAPVAPQIVSPSTSKKDSSRSSGVRPHRSAW